MNLAEYHKSRTGRLPESPPKRFTDKVFWRKVNDRRPFLGILTDKVKSKNLVGEHAIPTLHIGTDYEPHNYPFIAKPNNYSGQTSLIRNSLEWEQFQGRWERMKQHTYGQEKGEWAYKGINPQLIIEPVIQGYWEMKVYMFDGQPACFYVCGKRTDWRRAEKAGISYFWTDGEFIDVIHNGQSRPFKTVPFDFTEALQVAEKVTPLLDFVRTDLLVSDKVYVTEFTLYPGSGCIKFEPDNFDYELGGYWELPDLNMKTQKI